MPSDVLTQFLLKRAELKHRLAMCEASRPAGNRLGIPNTSALCIRNIKRDIAAYERAITMLIPRRLDA
jgi:hypothetical protein